MCLILYIGVEYDVILINHGQKICNASHFLMHCGQLVKIPLLQIIILNTLHAVAIETLICSYYMAYKLFFLPCKSTECKIEYKLYEVCMIWLVIMFGY